MTSATPPSTRPPRFPSSVASVVCGYLPAAIAFGFAVGWLVVWPVFDALSRIVGR
jgi:hypothetical protein